MAEHDPCRDLREVWQQVDAPSAAPCLSDQDELTRNAVQWMSTAWQQIEIPAARLPQRRPSFRSWKMPLAAAALLVISSVILLQKPQPEPSSVTTQTAAQVHPLASAVVPNPGQLAPRLIASTEQKVEILSGHVRLTMLRVPSGAPE